MMNEENAAAIMMGNLKGPKNKPSNLLEFGEACRFWTKKKGVKWTSDRFKSSQYMIRQIDKINDIDSPKLRKMIKEGKLGIEASYQLWRIKEPKRSQVATIVQDMTTDEIRRFVYFIMKNPLLSIDECEKMFEPDNPKEISLLVLPLDSDTYKNLEKESKRHKLKIHDYVLKLLVKENKK